MPQLRMPQRRTRVRILAFAVVAGGAFLVGLVLPGLLGFHVDLFAPPAGVALHDRAATDGGYVTVGVVNDQRVDLVARDGRVVHSWHLPYPLLGSAKLASDGSLLYMGQVPKWRNPATQTPPGAPGGVLQRLAWDGHVEWTFEDDLLSHDFAELPHGTIAALRLAPLPTAVEAAVPGGQPGTEANGQMWADQIVEIDPGTGAERVVFDAATDLDPATYPLPDFFSRAEWTHANSIQYTPSDPVSHQEAYLISFRQVSTIMLVSRKTGSVIWSYGGAWVLNQQHDPSLLANGHVLVFDNGQYRQSAVSASRVLEIDPLTNKVVWSYKGYGDFGTSFYSPITGGAQRLANGDTLITLGTKGQLLEVTPDGKIVWDYQVDWGPLDPNYPGKHLTFLFKSRSYPASEVSSLLSRE